MVELRKLFDKYECDKGYKHGYEKVYAPAMESKRNDEINILEVGIFKGVSIEAWLDYFPNATIYAIDIFTRVTPGELPILKKDRVKWLKADSLNQNLQNKLKSTWGDVKFDFIIDDGMHTPEANKLTFDNLKSFLKDDGVYFIEDAWPIDIMSGQEMGHPWIRSNQEEYDQMKMLSFLSSLEGYRVKRHDLRKSSGNPDSYIFEVKLK